MPLSPLFNELEQNIANDLSVERLTEAGLLNRKLRKNKLCYIVLSLECCYNRLTTKTGGLLYVGQRRDRKTYCRPT